MKPTAAGTTAEMPSPPISMAGMSSDHTEAATMTPEAKPSNDLRSGSDISSFMKNTKAEPSIVPSSGMRSPASSVIVVCVTVRVS